MPSQTAGKHEGPLTSRISVGTAGTAARNAVPAVPKRSKKAGHTRYTVLSCTRMSVRRADDLRPGTGRIVVRRGRGQYVGSETDEPPQCSAALERDHRGVVRPTELKDDLPIPGKGRFHATVRNLQQDRCLRLPLLHADFLSDVGRSDGYSSRDKRWMKVLESSSDSAFEAMASKARRASATCSSPSSRTVP